MPTVLCHFWKWPSSWKIQKQFSQKVAFTVNGSLLNSCAKLPFRKQRSMSAARTLQDGRAGRGEADSTGAEISNTEMFVNLWNLFRMRSFRKKKSWNWGQINVKGDSLCRIWGGCALKLGLSEVWRVSQRRRGRSPYSRGAAADASVSRQGEQTVAGYLPSVM